MGFYFVVSALMQIARYLFQMSFIIPSTTNDAAFVLQMKMNLIVIGIQLIVGLFILSKNYWLSVTLLKINTPESANAVKDTNQVD